MKPTKIIKLYYALNEWRTCLSFKVGETESGKFITEFKLIGTCNNKLPDDREFDTFLDANTYGHEQVKYIKL